MRVKIFTVLFLFSIFGLAQSSQISGRIKTEDGEPVPGAAVFIKDLNISTPANGEGEFHLLNIPEGTHLLSVKSIGFKTMSKTIVLETSHDLTLDFILREESTTLNEIVLETESDNARIRNQSIETSVLDPKEVVFKATATHDLLRRSSGVHIRQQGGLGSNTTINLNGMTGNSVRIYYDGIPLDYFGGAIQINNYPASLLGRLEVYKGVMPISVGSDALAGGINMVPKNITKDVLEMSYEFGSFNTHRATAVGRKKLNNKVIVGADMFYNYSNNDYIIRNTPTITTEVIENVFGRLDTIFRDTILDAYRFHNKHNSIYGNAIVQFQELNWADQLSFSLGTSYRYDEFQHGQRITKVAVGEAFREMISLFPMVKYRKELGVRWNIAYTGMFSYTWDYNHDNTENIYNWEGNILYVPNERNSELGGPTQRKGENLGTTHRILAAYNISNQHQFSISDFFTYSKISGNDPLGIRIDIGNGNIDPNTIPSYFQRNILGLELKSHWLKNSNLETVVFGKYYWYNAESIDIRQIGATRLPLRNNKANLLGGGAATKYVFSSNFFVKGSYEQSARIPTEQELFGNFTFIIPNYILRPERSNNVNLGLSYHEELNEDFDLRTDVNFFSRQQFDLIRLIPFGNGEQARHENEEKVTSQGIEIALQSTFSERVNVGASATYQKVAIAESKNITDESYVGVDVPNMPNLFWNANIDYMVKAKFLKQNTLQLFYNYLYVDDFSITYVLNIESANPENIVPTQHQHNFGITYGWLKPGLTMTLQINNILDSQLYDNFRVPKPGRYIAFKITYSII